MKDIDITEEINFFINFLNRNWNQVFNIIKKINDDFIEDDLFHDWYQFNWELYVESLVCKSGEFLSSYGDGSECNSDNGRIRYSDKEMTHIVLCKSKSESTLDYLSDRIIKIDGLEFYKFVSYKEEIYYNRPPFDYSILLDEMGESFLVKNSDIIFIKKKTAL